MNGFLPEFTEYILSFPVTSFQPQRSTDDLSTAGETTIRRQGRRKTASGLPLKPYTVLWTNRRRFYKQTVCGLLIPPPAKSPLSSPRVSGAEPVKAPYSSPRATLRSPVEKKKHSGQTIYTRHLRVNNRRVGLNLKSILLTFAFHI